MGYKIMRDFWGNIVIAPASILPPPLNVIIYLSLAIIFLIIAIPIYLISAIFNTPSSDSDQKIRPNSSIGCYKFSDRDTKPTILGFLAIVIPIIIFLLLICIVVDNATTAPSQATVKRPVVSAPAKKSEPKKIQATQNNENILDRKTIVNVDWLGNEHLVSANESFEEINKHYKIEQILLPISYVCVGSAALAFLFLAIGFIKDSIKQKN